MKNTPYTSLSEKKAKLRGKIVSGEVIDANPDDGDKPVIRPNVAGPNLIVDNEKARDYTEGDIISNVKITEVHESVLFGDRIKSDDERQEERAENYMVKLLILGNKFTSETYRDKQDAEDVADFLKNQLSNGRVEVERTK